MVQIQQTIYGLVRLIKTEEERDMDSYCTVYREGTGEIVEKKSRFIARVFPVASEEEAFDYLEAVKKRILGCKTPLLGLYNRKKSGKRKNE